MHACACPSHKEKVPQSALEKEPVQENFRSSFRAIFPPCPFLLAHQLLLRLRQSAWALRALNYIEAHDLLPPCCPRPSLMLLALKCAHHDSDEHQTQNQTQNWRTIFQHVRSYSKLSGFLIRVPLLPLMTVLPLTLLQWIPVLGHLQLRFLRFSQGLDQILHGLPCNDEEDV